MEKRKRNISNRDTINEKYVLCGGKVNPQRTKRRAQGTGAMRSDFGVVQFRHQNILRGSVCQQSCGCGFTMHVQVAHLFVAVFVCVSTFAVNQHRYLGSGACVRID